MKSKVLFLCTGNSCRSQMAVGWARHLLGDRIEPYSAGIEAHGLNPNAVRAMQEAGVDISGHTSKLVSTLDDVPLDLVITQQHSRVDELSVLGHQFAVRTPIH